MKAVVEVESVVELGVRLEVRDEVGVFVVDVLPLDDEVMLN